MECILKYYIYFVNNNRKYCVVAIRKILFQVSHVNGSFFITKKTRKGPFLLTISIFV